MRLRTGILVFFFSVGMVVSGWSAGGAKTPDISHLLKRADAGDPAAQFTLGLAYERGHGVEQNYVEAFRWYKTAADHGDAPSQTNLGSMYASGEGVREDQAEAVKWYMRAAVQG